MARLFRVPAGLIMRVWPTQIEVLVSSHTEGNPFEAHHKGDLNKGAYCETAMATRSPLMVPNALQDEDWRDNPDVKYDTVSYLGTPLIWSDGQTFGTICVLDHKTRAYSKLYQKLLEQFRGIVEGDFVVIQQTRELEQLDARCKQAEDVLQELTSELEERVAQRTAELRKAVNSMAGHEARVDELRAVIRRLRAQLDQAGLTPAVDEPLAAKS